MQNRLVGGYQRLYDGVVSSVHVRVEGERALSVAVVGCVAFRSDDPILRQDANYALEVSILSVFGSHPYIFYIFKLMLLF